MLSIGILPFPIKFTPVLLLLRAPRPPAPPPSKARSFLVGPVASIPHADARDASYVLKRMAARGHRPDPMTHTASIVAGKSIEVQSYPGLFSGFQ